MSAHSLHSFKAFPVNHFPFNHANRLLFPVQINSLSYVLYLQVHGHLIHSDGVQYVPEALEQQNQVQSLLPEPHSHQRRWSHHQHRSVGVLPQPEPEEETKPFILDLKNFPDLANADINSQNPNIQVSQERGDGHYCIWGHGDTGGSELGILYIYIHKLTKTSSYGTKISF